MNAKKTATPHGNERFASLKMAAEDKANEGVSKETIFKLDPFIIEIREGFNRPISREHIDNIKESIRGGAKIKPIDVAVERTAEKSTIYMVDGEHRMWAVRELIEEYRRGGPDGRDIPYMLATEFKGGIDDQIAHMLTSGQGLGVAPLVQGEKYADLIAMNWDVAKIAKRVGKSKTHVENCLALARSTPDVRESVRHDEVSPSLAVDLIRKHGSDAGEVIQQELKKAKAQGKSKLTPKAVLGAAVPRKLVSRFTDSIGTMFDALPPYTAEELAGKKPGTKVQIEMPVELLAELRGAHEELQKLRAKQAAASAAAAEKAREEGAADSNEQS